MHRTPLEGFNLINEHHKQSNLKILQMLNRDKRLQQDRSQNLNQNSTTFPQSKKSPAPTQNSTTFPQSKKSPAPTFTPKVNIYEEIADVGMSLPELKRFRRENDLKTKERLKKIKDDLNNNRG